MPCKNTLYMANKLKEVHIHNIDLDQHCRCRFPRKKDNLQKKSRNDFQNTGTRLCLLKSPQTKLYMLV